MLWLCPQLPGCRMLQRSAPHSSASKRSTKSRCSCRRNHSRALASVMATSKESKVIQSVQKIVESRRKLWKVSNIFKHPKCFEGVLQCGELKIFKITLKHSAQLKYARAACACVRDLKGCRETSRFLQKANRRAKWEMLSLPGQIMNAMTALSWNFQPTRKQVVLFLSVSRSSSQK